MLEINLLPPEMRKVDHTSLRRLLIMVSSVVLASGSLIALAITLKSHHAEAVENVAATAEVARLEPVAKEYDVLSSEIKGIETRVSTIEQIEATRMRWGLKLDQLYAILPEYVWFDKIDLKNVRSMIAGQNTNVATLLMDCYLAGADEKKYAEFRRVLTGEVVGEGPYTGREFFKDFASISDAGWTRETFASTEEGVALKCELELAVKSSVAPPEAPKPVVRPVVAATK